MRNLHDTGCRELDADGSVVATHYTDADGSYLRRAFDAELYRRRSLRPAMPSLTQTEDPTAPRHASGAITLERRDHPVQGERQSLATLKKHALPATLTSTRTATRRSNMWRYARPVRRHCEAALMVRQRRVLPRPTRTAPWPFTPERFLAIYTVQVDKTGLLADKASSITLCKADSRSQAITHDPDVANVNFDMPILLTASAPFLARQ